MHTRIVTLPSAKIREVARVALEGYWKQVVLFMFFYYLIDTGISNVLDIFFCTYQEIPLGDTGETLARNIHYGSSIYTAIISGPMSWALSKFMLDFFRYQKAEQSTVLEGFSCFARTFVLMMIIGAKIFLWSLLFVIPGIVASFRYSQAFYVMVDNPEYSALKCISESCRIMNGNKQKYLYLNLSFIGWNMLASLPALCFATMLTEANGISFVLLDLVFSIPILFVNAYMNMALTVFYELATDNLTIVDQTQPEAASEVKSGWDASMYSAPAPEETLAGFEPVKLPEAEAPVAEEETPEGEE